MLSVDHAALRAAVDGLIEQDDLVCNRCPGFVITHTAAPTHRHFVNVGDRDPVFVAIDGLAAAAFDSYASLLKHHGDEILGWRRSTSHKLLRDAQTETAISVPALEDLWSAARDAVAVLVPIGWREHRHVANAPAGLRVLETSALEWAEAVLVRGGQGTYYVNRAFDIRLDGPKSVISTGSHVVRLELSRPVIQYVTVAQLI
jgi:hypothetical protein